MIEYPIETIGSGEMLDFERKLLFDTLIKKSPKVVLETGTGSAGGSTFFILNALSQLNNGGMLYTCDPMNSSAATLYSNTSYKDILYFSQVPSDILIKRLKTQDIIPDFIFFDGPEIQSVALLDFQELENYVDIGCVFCMHDWETRPRIDGNTSIKSVDIREYLHQSSNWKITTELSGIDGEYPNNPGYNSVGMVVAEKIANKLDDDNTFMLKWDNSWGTHQSVLAKMASKNNAKILEFGCGHFSSKLLNWLKPQYNLSIQSFEADKEWINTIQPEISYEITPVDNWSKIYEKYDFDQQYDLIFVDQSPWEARHETIRHLKDKCEYLILHDCDYYPHENIFQYDDYFKHWKIFLPPKPWEWKTGPPTLLASNYNSCDLDITYNKLLYGRTQ